MGLYSGGLIIGRIFAFEIWGDYFLEGLFFIYLFIYLILFFITKRIQWRSDVSDVNVRFVTNIWPKYVYEYSPQKGNEERINKSI